MNRYYARMQLINQAIAVIVFSATRPAGITHNGWRIRPPFYFRLCARHTLRCL
jgi:hypothetical protein